MTINNVKNRKKIWAAPIATAGIPVFITCSFAFLSLVDDLRLDIPFLIFITALLTILIAFAIYLDETVLNKKNSPFQSCFVIILVAIIIRGFFIFQPVQLSDDIFRYYIDGHQLLTGHNPYAKAPECLIDQKPFVSELLTQVNHPKLVSIYPPAAQFIFAAGAMFKTLSGIKAILAIMDIGNCILVIILLVKLNLPISRSILYAWNPLPVIETASSGHVDAAAVFFLLLSFLLVCNKNSGLVIRPATLASGGPPGGPDLKIWTNRNFKMAEVMTNPKNSFKTQADCNNQHDHSSQQNMKVSPPHSKNLVGFHIKRISLNSTLATILSGFFFACAFLTKLFPIVFLPAFFILAGKGRRIYFITAFLAGTGILSAFFFPDILNAFNTLTLYTKTWEFSGFIFRLLRQLTHSGDLARLILAGGFALVISFSSLRLYLLKPDIENSMFTNTMKTAYTISFSYLLLTPTLHAWYALYLLIFLPFVPGSAGIIMSWAVFMGYYILTPYALLGIWEEKALVPFLIFSAPMLGFILYQLSRKNIRKVAAP